MKRKLNFFIVDDDRISIKLMARFIENAGHHVDHETSSMRAFSAIVERPPDCVILDIMMPEMDGLEILKRLRSEPALDATKIIIVSAKSYEFDRKRAYGFGANGYITKPIDTQRFLPQILRILADSIEMTFWGVHGTLPIPGKSTTRYGGNTSCISLDFSRGNLFVFDAGTGIKKLSDHLVGEKRTLQNAKIFISHPHWDHINAFPFFVPLYTQGNEIEICGPAQGDITINEIISGQMDGVYFPIKIKEFGATIAFRDLKEESIDMDGIQIHTMLLNHPGYCLGYRLEYGGRSICYVTDNEIYPENSPYYNAHYVSLLENFVKQTDALVTDTTYLDHEYQSKIGWGHSAIGRVVELAHRARVKSLYLYHHDLDQTDKDIDAKLAAAQAYLKKKKSKTRCIAPKEKQTFKI